MTDLVRGAESRCAHGARPRALAVLKSAAAGVMLVAGLAMACTRVNADYCDESIPCSREPDTFCDLLTNGCMQPPPGSCQRDDHCSDTAPICNLASETCRGCMSNAECAARDPNTPYCDGSGECVGVQTCADSAECTGATAPICSAEGACVPCDVDGAGDAECTSKDPARPWCLAGGACAACRESSHCAAAMPVCDAETHTCRPCSAHGECSSEVCHLDGPSEGRCASVDAIVYVAINGTDGVCGDQSTPCRTLEEGLDTLKETPSRTILRVRGGTYNESVVLEIGRAFAVIGDAGTIIAGGAGAPAVGVVGNSDATLDGLTIRPGATRHGVLCDSSTASITVVRSVVENATDYGAGVSAPSCRTVVVRQSIIRNNEGGGVSVFDVDTDLVNSFITGNGTFGGVRIVETTSDSEYALRFSTIADNTEGAGVACPVPGTAITLTNNIVYGNVGEQVSTDCQASPPAMPGCPADGNNTEVDPRFIGGGDYHLQADSPCRNKATAGGVLIDIDGDPRPQGAGEADVGADEVVP